MNYEWKNADSNGIGKGTTRYDERYVDTLERSGRALYNLATSHSSFILDHSSFVLHPFPKSLSHRSGAGGAAPALSIELHREALPGAADPEAAVSGKFVAPTQEGG